MTDRLEAIESRLRAATGGEWRAQLFIKDSDCKAYVASDNSNQRDGSWITRTICITHMPLFDGNENADFIAHCGGDNGDVAFLLGEVQNLHHQLNDMTRQAREIANDGYEAQSLALSLAEALHECGGLAKHNKNMGWNGETIAVLTCIEGAANTAISDERLTKLREMKNV